MYVNHKKSQMPSLEDKGWTLVLIPMSHSLAGSCLDLGMRPGNEAEWVDYWVYTVAHLYNEVDITARVGDVEYG